MADDDVKAALADPSGPPLGFDARDIIERGGKIRRRRKRLAAVLGTSATTAAAVVVIALAAAHRADVPAPVQPAGPGLSLESGPPSASSPATNMPGPMTTKPTSAREPLSTRPAARTPLTTPPVAASGTSSVARRSASTTISAPTVATSR
jgi:hypothetical protein